MFRRDPVAKKYPSVLMGATRLDAKLSVEPFAYTVFAEFPLLAHRDKLRCCTNLFAVGAKRT
jgi:hypothetical protein